MKRLALLLGLWFRLRRRAIMSAGASSIFLVIGGLIYLGLTCAMGVAAYFALASARSLPAERAGHIVALVVTFFGAIFLSRPLIFANLSGGSLQNLLHLPIRRSELLAYSLLTGVVMPLILESPVLIGASLGAASQPSLVLITFPLAFLAHLTLLAGAHSMSLVSILIARRAWVADAARVVAFSVFFLPSLVNFRGAREFLRPILIPLAQISPLGWAARGAVYAGKGDITEAAWFVLPALLLLLGICFVSMTMLERILDGEGGDHTDVSTGKPRPARILLPGATGALIETQMRSQMRMPAARMALLIPTLMMGLLAFTMSRSGAIFSPFAMVVFLSLAGGNAFPAIGRGVAMILGTPVSRLSVLLSSDLSGILFRVLPLAAILMVTTWRSGWEASRPMIAFVLTLLPISMGIQQFVSLLRPVPLPRDRLNPYAQRADARQSSQALVGLFATLVTGLLAAPFLALVWLSSRIAEGQYEISLQALACLGALASYAVLLAFAERLFVKRELQILEVLLDDSPG
jgi:hypothetical protein